MDLIVCFFLANIKNIIISRNRYAVRILHKLHLCNKFTFVVMIILIVHEQLGNYTGYIDPITKIFGSMRIVFCGWIITDELK